MYEPIEHVHQTKTYLLEQISAMMGGRAAEELFFNEVTTGASNDIEKATQVTRTMVVEYGMSELGPLNLESGRRYMYEKNEISPDMLAKIDKEVQRILEERYAIALQTLKKLKPEMHQLAKRLLEKETLEAEEFIQIVGPKKLKKETGKDPEKIIKA